MFDRSERHSTRWIAWMPLLFVSAFLYWSVALGLGGLSLMATSAVTGGCRHSWAAGIHAASIEPMPGELSGDPIIVHLQESADVGDGPDDDALQLTVDSTDDDGTGRLPGHAE
jgi:hypothetical protein